jgi:uncharacterized protein
MLKFRFAAAAALLVLWPGEIARAQSFDCAAARSPIEKQVCDKPWLSALDYELARVFRAALKGAGADHDALLAGQREWLKRRDAQCGELTQDAKASACIQRAYQDRLAELNKRLPADEDARKAPCEALVKAYSEKITSDPHSAFVVSPSGFASANDPSQFVLNAQKSLAHFDRDEILRHFVERLFLHREQPPNAPMHGLHELAAAARSSSVELDHLPNTDVYALSAIAGTLSCYQFDYVFRMRKSSAYYISAPEGWEKDESDGCMVSRDFGTLSEKPIAFETSFNRSFLRETIRLSSWIGDHFAPACKAEFAFAPTFDERPPRSAWAGDDGYSDCEDDACQNLRSKTVELIEQIVRGPRGALADAMASLNDEQRRKFAEWIAGRNIKPSASNDWMDFDADDPFLAPLLLNGRLFVAQLWHFDIHDVAQPDWKVSIEPVLGSASYTFLVGTRPGRFLSAKVE